MALTKYQKLARGIKFLSEALEIHYQKTANFLNVLQFHFYETHLLIGRALMSEQTLRNMMQMHRLGIQQFSPNPELKSAALQSPLIGCILTSRFYPRSNVMHLPPEADRNGRIFIPWGVKIILPRENLTKLEEAKSEAILYSASKEEMSEWIDWFDQEDKATSLTNQLLEIDKDFQERAMFEKNLKQPSVEFYRQALVEFYKLPKDKSPSKALLNADFAPKEEDDTGTAFRKVSASLANHKKRHFEDFQRFWRDQLKKLMFQGMMSCESGRQLSLLNDYFLKGETKRRTFSNPRWETGSTLDRQTYSAFIRYFSDYFIASPSKRKAEGEIALLLRIKVYAALDLENPVTIKELLSLTTANVSGRYIIVNDKEIEISCGLADLVKEYVGDRTFHRQKKLFPHLSIDRLEDQLRRASKKILPPGSIAALPEAFLSFPHPHKNSRINVKVRHDQLMNPPKILHDSISYKELKQQLVAKSNHHSSKSSNQFNS